MVAATDTPLDWQTLAELDRAHLLHSQHHPDDNAAPLIFTRGEGVMLWDAAGKRYIDGLAGLWNVLVGHGRRELAEAAAAQMTELAFCNSYSGSSNVPAIQLAARVAKLAPEPLNTVFFTTGGAESNETAFRTVRFYWHLRGRPEKVKVIAREQGYHGTTAGAASATGFEMFRRGFGPPAPGFLHVPALDAGALEAAIVREGPETVAAFIAEPVQGVGGVIVPPDDYFPRVRAICDRYEVLLIADEVITGFGRTGRFWGLANWGVVPDVLCFAKGITSGYLPLGGMILSDAIRDTLYNVTPDRRWLHAYTYSSHATCCAVGLANLDVLEREGLVGRARVRGRYFLERLRPLADLPAVAEVRGLGLMAGLSFRRPDGSPATEMGERVVKEAKARGLFTRHRAEHLLLAPPLVITEAEVDELVGILDEAIRAAAG